MGIFTGLVSDRKSARLFRIEIDKSTLIPENRTAFMVEKDGPDFLEFSELPDNLNLNKSAYWNNEQVVGRGEPWKNYASTSPTRINFTAKLVATGGSEAATGFVRGLNDVAGFGLGLAGRFAAPTQPFLGIAGNVISAAGGIKSGSALRQFLGGDPDDKIKLTFEEVHQKLAWLEALLHPQVTNEGRSFPPPAVFLCYGGNFRRRGVIPDVSFVFRGPWEVNTIMCMLVEVSIVFEESNAVPKSYNEVRNREQPVGEVAGANFSSKAEAKGGITAADFARSVFGI